MPGISKKYIEIVYQGTPIIVAAIQESTPLDFAKIKKQAEANFAALLEKIENKINRLENDVKILKGEE